MGENDIIATKKQVRKAGENIRNDTASEKDYEIISIWRSLHAQIMSSFATSINRKLKSKKIPAKVMARRLKRLSSIEFKLKRFSNMQLDRMQDIAGLRVVFENIKQVRLFQQIMEQTYLNDSRKFKLIKTNDYINTPKSDGYRSIHQIYEYKDKTKRGLELQIRTQMQHLWATAVEVLGIKSKSKIKQGYGEEYYKEFFRLSSALFSIIENTEINNDYKSFSKKQICNEISKLDKEYNILKMLSSLLVSSKNIEELKQKDHYYFVIELNTDAKKLRITGYKKSDFNKAKEYYDFLEKTAIKTNESDIVLISLDKIKTLRSAYPNYYLDSREFVKVIEKAIK
ncbi:RelA/SpoT domain-containing protein [Campylobacter sp. MG1]|uniref:RelA/SpoT domain-containing protein n=1 Tax=Campylobacter sp. MG1 TaxID=2976332 RepID=UPI00226CD8C0|nr:RelA/SpoT domain-containing protein [Campylobacter sp. MG1]